MHIRKLRLFNYKNYEEVTLHFSEGINCFVGPNGSGKTNLVDAIYYLGLTKSASALRDKDVIRHGESGFSLKSEWKENNLLTEVSCAYQAGGAKVFQLDGVPYEQLREHVGRLPLVLVAPNDTDIIRGSSEIRRRFFDVLLCQADARYLEILMRYNHVLKQRNALLRRFGPATDRDLLVPYTQQLIEFGGEIFDKRMALTTDFQQDFEQYYSRVSSDREKVGIVYESHGQRNLPEVFSQTLEKDLIMGRTSAGIHRDDYHFLLETQSIKKFGSQGQQKSLVIALKLAQFNYLNHRKNSVPIILLDDIFDKLDIERIKSLLDLLQEDGMGQVFLTDARPNRTRDLMTSLGVKVKYFNVNLGQIHEVEE